MDSKETLERIAHAAACTALLAAGVSAMRHEDDEGEE